MFHDVQVQEWLESVFAGEEVPDYEITHGTVDRLWQLAVEGREREGWVETLVEDLEQKTQEYAAESEGWGLCITCYWGVRRCDKMRI